MGNDFQRQALHRKLIYTGLIVGLFSATLFYRPYVLEAHANSLGLREENLGEVNFLGAVMRRSLYGSRGLVLCGLWSMTTEKQKKHEWNQLEVLVDAIAQLTPHTIAPWKFQSWNFAYNVSAECESARDKYFWISRGIDMAAQGVRHNLQNAELRSTVGYYYWDKIGWADQRRLLRTLFALSCIDPRERDPANLRRADGSVDLVKFRAFCENYPQLARRLKEMHGCRTPEEALKFLGENWELPSRYELAPPGTSLAMGRSRLKAPEQQFPVLPPHTEGSADEEYSPLQPWPAGFDNYAAAVVWYAYAQEALAPPDPSGAADTERTPYRKPRGSLIFRSFLPLSQTNYAKQLERDGWFDRGWAIDGSQPGSTRWFPENVVVGEQAWASKAWQKARDAWEKFGRSNGLLLEQAELDRLEALARKYREAFAKGPNDLDRKLTANDFEGEMRSSFDAHSRLYWYHANRNTYIRFGHFYAEAVAESDPEAIQARELFYEARQKRKAAALDREILDIYERAFPIWQRVLRRYRDFRKDPDVQEFTCRQQMRYFDLMLEKQNPELKRAIGLQDELEQKKVDLKKLILVTDLLGHGAARPAVCPLWPPPGHCFMTRALIELPPGPFDGVDDDGQPLIGAEAIQRAKFRIDPDEVN
jgi:hypothetical protein